MAPANSIRAAECVLWFVRVYVRNGHDLGPVRYSHFGSDSCLEHVLIYA